MQQRAPRQLRRASEERIEVDSSRAFIHRHTARDPSFHPATLSSPPQKRRSSREVRLRKLLITYWLCARPRKMKHTRYRALFIHHQLPLFREFVGRWRGEDLLTVTMAMCALAIEMHGVISIQKSCENPDLLEQRGKQKQCASGR